MRDESVFRGMLWQELGPRFMGGRVETIDAIPGTGTIYVGFGAGNVWKTTNNGLNWKAVFEHESSVTIGDLEISDSHPHIVWVGTGENLMARSSFAGMGVFQIRRQRKDLDQHGPARNPPHRAHHDPSAES